MLFSSPPLLALVLLAELVLLLHEVLLLVQELLVHRVGVVDLVLLDRLDVLLLVGAVVVALQVASRSVFIVLFDRLLWMWLRRLATYFVVRRRTARSLDWLWLLRKILCRLSFSRWLWLSCLLLL